MYQIYTEDVNRDSINKILSQHFQGFTEIPATGYWEGKPEASLVVDVETDDKTAVLDSAEQIRETNQQQAVLVSHVESTTSLVSESKRDVSTSNASMTERREDERRAA